VRIERTRLHPVRLDLRAPLATGHGLIRQREGFLVEVIAASGTVGWGECLPLPGFGDAAACMRAALECAALDCEARERGEPLAAYLTSGGPARRHIPLSALVSGDSQDAAADEAARAVADGFAALKLKLGARDLARDEARVAAVRQAAGPGIGLRLDANGAWTEREALCALERLARYDVAFVEQPVPAQDLPALARVRRAAPIPVAADEAVLDEDSAVRVLEAGAADWLVLKPAIAGLRAAVRVAERARRCGVGVVVTGFLDSAIGRTAAAHVAAALPDPIAPAGLATGALLRDDLSGEEGIEGGALQLPEGAGLGLTPDPGRLARLASGKPRELAA
jgi:o-succinylbenzoate synthase